MDNLGTNKRLMSAKALFITIILTLMTFASIVHWGYKVDYENLGGGHAWLSGSTLVFVNNWLEEGAANLGFTNYEIPASIEFETLERRSPYVSYPTGTTMFVCLVAKALGKTRIDIEFLKIFQVCCFTIEVVLFAIFVYLFLSNINKIKEDIKVFVAVSLAVLWAMMPLNGWYLCNIYFADQCVILWVMAFLLIEYLSKMKMSPKYKLFNTIAHVGVIYSGMLIDYYFWVLVFVAFIIRTLSSILRKEKLQRILQQGMGYILPVFAGVGTFLLQVTQIPNWFEILKEKFMFRTGMTGEENLWAMMKTNLLIAFGQSSKILFLLLSVFMVVAVLIISYYYLKKYKIKEMLINNQVQILLIGIVAPVMQIILLFNHSSVHIFSMVKLGWVIAALVLIVSFGFWRLLTINVGNAWERNVQRKYFVCYIAVYCVVALILGIPNYTIECTEKHYKTVSYPLEELIYANTDYEDVCFSFTEKIPINPPMSLAVSGKRIYLVESLEELFTEASKLPKNAKILLVVNEKSENLSNEQVSIIWKLKNECEIRCRDGKYCLIEIISATDI